MGGVEATRIVKQGVPETKVLFKAVHASHIDDALEAGADGFMIFGGLLATSFPLKFESSLEHDKLRSKSPTPSAIPRSYYEPAPINGREMAAPKSVLLCTQRKQKRTPTCRGALYSAPLPQVCPGPATSADSALRLHRPW